jgi:hypothetical protein
MLAPREDRAVLARWYESLAPSVGLSRADSCSLLHTASHATCRHAGTACRYGIAPRADLGFSVQPSRRLLLRSRPRFSQCHDWPSSVSSRMLRCSMFTVQVVSSLFGSRTASGRSGTLRAATTSIGTGRLSPSVAVEVICLVWSKPTQRVASAPPAPGRRYLAFH